MEFINMHKLTINILKIMMKIKSLYLKYWDANNLYGWAISQRLPVNKFEWIEDTSQFKADFLKNYKNESEEEYFFEVDIQYPEKSHKLHNDLPYLTDKLNIEKVEKLATDLYDKIECVIYIRNLKPALNHGLILKKTFIEWFNLIKKSLAKTICWYEC